jgi:hypothetical protein
MITLELSPVAIFVIGMLAGLVALCVIAAIAAAISNRHK